LEEDFMAKKTLGYVRLEWTCTYCGTRNPGPAKFCLACGKEQTEDVEFHQAASEEFITDINEIGRAKAGPDVHCPYCQARNPAHAKFCGECGGNLAEGIARQKGRVVGAHLKDAPATIKCPACGTPNPASEAKCRSCGANLIPAKKESAVAQKAAKRPSLGLLIGAGLVAIACITIGLLLLLGKKELTGTVQALAWERSIGIEAFGPVEEEGWKDEIPSGATLGSCSEKLHHTQNDPEAGAVEVCGTPYTVDTGTGHGEVVQDCEYEIYAEWCTYTVNEWAEVDRITISGSDANPYWPSVTLATGQREGSHTQQYEVVFATPDRTYTYTIEDVADFQQFLPGSEWLLTVNTFGSVVSVEAAQ
jgi:ribosomal protein L40E